MLQTRLMHQHVNVCVERLQYSHCNAYRGLIIVANALINRAAEFQSLLYLLYNDGLC